MSTKFYVVAENLRYPPTQEGADEAMARQLDLEVAGFANVLAIEVVRDAELHHYNISFGPYDSRAEAVRFVFLTFEEYGFQLGIVEVDIE